MSNHVHLLLDAKDRLQISGLMRNAAGEFARAYNRRKGRMNAFGGDNFHATLVEEGRYRWRCLCYIELNRVRCGVVSHPQGWEWVGYHEIMGHRRRYRWSERLAHTANPIMKSQLRPLVGLTPLRRKNSMFYRTERGAQAGDLFMSLIETCPLCDTNPVE